MNQCFRNHKQSIYVLMGDVNTKPGNFYDILPIISSTNIFINDISCQFSHEDLNSIRTDMQNSMSGMVCQLKISSN